PSLYSSAIPRPPDLSPFPYTTLFRSTREWFHSGRAKYRVEGPGAEDFEGTLELGYQIGFPWSLGVGVNFSYTTPNILIDGGDITDRKSTRLNSSHVKIAYAVFCLKKK